MMLKRLVSVGNYGSFARNRCVLRIVIATAGSRWGNYWLCSIRLEACTPILSYGLVIWLLVS